ncbi:phenoloxidase-activating factor 2-like isoform X2 [Rhodnius prolixus]|uniref:phenoloxidase-activating factor 2-like isoform X2 n=1 Tax=Rhodnius prolixus TaxID=13249 RepID=UPI003D188330
MLGRTTGLLCLLAVLSWTTVYGQGSENLGSLIDEVFGPPPSEQPGDGGAQTVNNNDNNNNNNEDTRGNEALTDTGSNAGNGLGGEKCTCVPYYLCANNTIITDGTGLLDIRIRADQCENYMDVCCGEPLEPENAIKPKPHGRLGCGKRNVDGVGFRITGNVNNEAQFGEFPWMVAVLKEDILDDSSKLNIYQCGGSLIHEQVVLTAAHCVIGKAVETLKVRVGEWDTQTSNELYPHQDRQVAQMITHEKYYSGALHNDVALLILRDPIEFADNVDITCLPLQGDVILNNECYASGWGKDVFGKEGHYQVILKRVDLPMVPRDKCEAELRKTRLGPYFRLHDSFVCAGGVVGKDTCKGDGGSPLVCPIPGRDYQYQQVGIVAWGIGCGNETPAVYVNVAQFRDWIDNHMRKLNFKFEYNY